MWFTAFSSRKVETSVAQTAAHAKKWFIVCICMQRLPWSWLLQQLRKSR